MGKVAGILISNRTVEALRVEKDTVFWDLGLSGFGVRVYPSGAKYYVAQTRYRGRTKRLTVGRHGVIRTEEARRRAALTIAQIKAGEAQALEPVASRMQVPTVTALAERYLREYAEEHCKPSTVKSYRHRIETHVIPTLGRLPLSRVRREDVRELHFRLKDRPVMANRAVDMLSRMFGMAESWGLVPEGSNPCRDIVKYRERSKERFLSTGEFRRLGRELDRAKKEGVVSADAATAIRLLMLTGCRKSEVLTLEWRHVDLAAMEFRLPDSKTGPRTVSISPEAAHLLSEIPRNNDSPWVIQGRSPDRHLSSVDEAWYAVRGRAGLDDVRLHDLRHSFASRALALGESLPAIGRLLGHADIQTTARYAHLARDSMHEAAERISGSIAADIL